VQQIHSPTHFVDVPMGTLFDLPELEAENDMAPKVDSNLASPIDRLDSNCSPLSIGLQTTDFPPKNWDVDQIILWLQEQSLSQEKFKEISEIIRKEEINGKSMVLLTEDDWRRLGVLQMGPIKILTLGFKEQVNSS